MLSRDVMTQQLLNTAIYLKTFYQQELNFSLELDNPVKLFSSCVHMTIIIRVESNDKQS